MISRFTIHEHANYDLPAALKTCSEVTGTSGILYIGHSMGTTAFLAMMCSNNKSGNLTNSSVLD